MTVSISGILQWSCVPVLAFLSFAASIGNAAEPAKSNTLNIGATGTLTGVADSLKEKTGNDLLQTFIKEETGLQTTIKGQLSWDELAQGMLKGEFHIGVFQGYEFAWLLEKHSEFKPLAVAVNVVRYPAGSVLTSAKNPAAKFADLEGKALAIPASCHQWLRMFVDRQCDAAGKKADKFFSAITSPDNIEDCLDDVVDGKQYCAIVDEAALESYKRRKPGRFKLLKEVVRSQPFPPIVVAYLDSTLDEASRKRFLDSLLAAARKEKGELLLTLAKLTAFEAVPDDLSKVLEATRKAYPVTSGNK